MLEMRKMQKMHIDNRKNAKGKYGWHFDVVRDTKYAKITFEDKDDAFWFRLRNKIT